MSRMVDNDEKIIKILSRNDRMKNILEYSEDRVREALKDIFTSESKRRR